MLYDDEDDEGEGLKDGSSVLLGSAVGSSVGESVGSRVGLGVG